MLNVTGYAPADGVDSFSDAWVPLRISWAAGGTSTPLYLVVRDPAGGVVEFKVDPDSGALVGFVAVHLPVLEDHTPQPLEDGFEGTVCLDLQLWPWTETPDYREPTVGRIDREARLSASADSGRLTLWFGEGEAATRVWAGDVELAVSSTSQLVAVSAPLSPGVSLDGFLT